MKALNIRGRPVGDGLPPLICTPLVGKTRTSVLAELADILPKQPDLIEWRVDFFEEIGNGAQVIDLASRIKSIAGETPIIFTCRSMAEGGECIALSDADIVKLYVAACASGCIDIIDYELGNSAEHLSRLRNTSRDNGVAMIMSYHDFQRTPDASTLDAKFANAARLGADIAKVAVMPQKPDDVLVLLSATLRASRSNGIPVIGLAMGGCGAISRLIGGQFGSAVTFAVGKGSSAPGQIPIEELRIVRRIVDASICADNMDTGDTGRTMTGEGV